MAKPCSRKAVWFVDEAKGIALLQGLPMCFVASALRRRKREDYAWCVRIGPWFRRDVSPNVAEACIAVEREMRQVLHNVLALVDHAEQGRKAK